MVLVQKLFDKQISVCVHQQFSYLQGNILRPLLFNLYMNNLPDAIHWNRALLFADDTKCFKHIKSPDDKHYLQNNLHDLASWSVNSSKSIHVSFNQTIPTS